MTLSSSTPRVWNYWMWDENGEYRYKYDHALDDHPDHEFLRDTEWDDRWSQKFFWTAKEAALLSFGRSPTKVSWEDPHFGVEQADCDSEFATHACSVFREIIKAQARQVLPPAIPAKMYVEWALANDMPFPPNLANAVLAHYELVMSQKNQPTVDKKISDETNEKVNPRLEHNYLRVILGLARAKYGYPKPGVAQKISGVLATEGMTLSDDTILKYLRAAEALGPKE